MFIKDLLENDYLTKLITAIQDLLADLSAKDIEEIDLKRFQEILAKQGYTTNEPELIQAIEQSGFANVVDDEIMISAGNEDGEEDSPFADAPFGPPDPEGGPGGLGGGPGGLGGGPGGLGDGVGGMDELGDEPGEIGEPGEELGDNAPRSNRNAEEDDEENMEDDVFARAQDSSIDDLKARV